MSSCISDQEEFIVYSNDGEYPISYLAKEYEDESSRDASTCPKELSNSELEDVVKRINFQEEISDEVSTEKYLGKYVLDNNGVTENLGSNFVLNFPKSKKSEQKWQNSQTSINDFSNYLEAVCPFSSENPQDSRISVPEEERNLYETLQNIVSELDEVDLLQIKLPQAEEEVKQDGLEELKTQRSSTQSKHLFRKDNIRKATIRALNKVVKTHLDRCLERYYLRTGKDLKSCFLQYKKEVFDCFKTCMEEVLGYSLPDIDTKEVYAIFFDLCLRKKNAMNAMVNFSSKCERKHISEALKRYKKQGKAYKKEDGEYCFSHVVMEIARKLYVSSDEYKEVFKNQVLDTRKKIGIKDREAYLKELIEEMNFINYDDNNLFINVIY
ncbi:unnamed protein product [Moneuplotes crassus]|uniref:Uncharacterized protein n=1 Tax=Euplotes crassus TaxID=5936 RepID=A0AAD1UC65_EUPCR|nr:unnamed protein product [Moneuplotes crassus]